MTYYSKHYLSYSGLDQKMINKEFISSCSRGNIEQMKYLISSEELFYKAQLDIISKNSLRAAILMKQDESIYLLINEFKIKKTKEIEWLLDEYKSPLAESLFLKRDLNLSTRLNKTPKI